MVTNFLQTINLAQLFYSVKFQIFANFTFYDASHKYLKILHLFTLDTILLKKFTNSSLRDLNL